MAKVTEKKVTIMVPEYDKDGNITKMTKKKFKKNNNSFTQEKIYADEILEEYYKSYQPMIYFKKSFSALLDVFVYFYYGVKAFCKKVLRALHITK